MFSEGVRLGLAPLSAPEENKSDDDIPQEVMDLAKERLLCKKNKDYAKADAIRAQIKELGYVVVDTKEGVTINKA